MCVCVLILQFGEGATVLLYPAVVHSVPLAVFASIIAPFGGFFASGFKRAFSIKVCVKRIELSLCILNNWCRILLILFQAMEEPWTGLTVKF